MVSIHGLMERPITESGKITKYVGAGFICGRMDASTTGNGTTMICKGTVFISIQMV